MHELFVEFLEKPTLESFTAVRDFVVTHPNYDGYARDLDKMDEALKKKQWAEVKTIFGEAMPNLLLSPGAHMLLCFALRQEGHEQGSDMERFICLRCLDGIKLTGDGTQERPYLVLRTSDEYDLLGALGKQFASQHLVHGENGKSFDKMVCADGSEVWFDITEMMAKMAQKFNK